MSRWAAISCVLAATMLCSVVNIRAATPWYNSSWSYRLAVTINHTNVSGTLTNFPVLINLTNNPLSQYAQTSGNDLLFTSGDGTNKLAHEIENYSSSNGTLTAWVKVPSVSSAADTTLYLYYGNSSTANQENATAVWDSNFKAVWHLNDNSAATPAPLYQWTFDNGDGVPVISSGGGTLSVRTLQGTGPYISFDATGGLSQGVLNASGNGYSSASSIALATNLSGLGTLSQFTLTFWVKQPSITNNLSRIIEFGASSGYDNGGKSATLNNGFGVAFSYGQLQPGFGSTNKYFSNAGLNTYGSPIGTNVWTFVSLLYDGTSALASNSPAMSTATGGTATNNMATYMGTIANAVSFDDQAAITPNSISDYTSNLGPISFGNSATVLMGNQTNTANPRGLTGLLDDVRIYNSVLTPAQLEAIRLSGIPNITDSTSNARDGVGTNMMSGDAQPAKVAGGMNFDGDTNQYIQTTSGESKTANALTWECWFKAGSTTFAHHLMAQGTNTADGWGNATSNEPAMTLSLGDYTGGNVNNRLSFFFGDTDSGRSAGVIDAAAAFSDTSAWHYAAAVVTNISVSPGATLYLDGVAVASDTGTVARTVRSTWNTNLRLGAAPTGLNNFLGVMDEVRVSDTNRSAAWIATEYNNFNSPGTFHSTGTTETIPPTALAITSVNGGNSPLTNSAFSVVVQAQDAGGTARNVTADTVVSLSLNTGSGSLGGTLTGTITAGTSSVTFSAVTYTVAQSGVVITATRTSGDSLTAGNSSAFQVIQLVVATIYLDHFSGASGALNNRTPDTATTSGNKWIASTNWTTDGTRANVTNAGNSAFLPFVPVAGRIYRLSADLECISAGAPDTDWIALGFANGTNTGTAWYLVNNPVGWQIARFSGNVTYPDQTFTGTGVTGPLDTTVYPTNMMNYGVILDTRPASASAWTFTFLINSNVMRTVAFGGSGPVISSVGFGMRATGGGRSYAKNFTLTMESAALPTKLAISSVNSGSNPTVGAAFSVVVQVQDASSYPVSVLTNTAVTLSLNTGSGTLGGTLTGTIPAGSSSVTISGVTYNKAGSGVVLTATRNSGDSLTAGNSSAFTVNPAAVTVSSGLTANNKIYDGTTTATISSNNVVLSGVLAGDTANVKLSTNGYTASFGTAGVGASKAVTVSGLLLTGSAAGNYTLTQPAGLTASITAAPLTVTANNTNRVYGAANPSFTAGYSGFINAETASLVQGAPGFSTTAITSSPVNTYPITPSLGSLTATNYSFITFNNGTLTITKAGSTNVVATSANPSPTGSNVTFTATLTAVLPGSGTPTGNVQFLTDGAALGVPATLSSGVASLTTNSLAHGTRIITAQYAGDGNFFGSTNTLNPNQVINSAPVVGSNTLSRYPTTGVKARVTTLLAKDADPDGDTLSFRLVNAASAQGGTIATNFGWAFYTPPASYTNADNYSYVISDGSLQATGAVAVAIISDTNAAQNIELSQNLGNGSFLTSFFGIPGRTYTIQYTTNLTTPNWQALGTAVADATGQFQFTDSPGTNLPARFYRSTYP